MDPEEPVPCPRCLGTGRVDDYEHVADGHCFACDGTGVIARRKLRSVTTVGRYHRYARALDGDYRAEVDGIRALIDRFGESAFELLEQLRDSDSDDSYQHVLMMLREGDVSGAYSRLLGPQPKA